MSKINEMQKHEEQEFVRGHVDQSLRMLAYESLFRSKGHGKHSDAEVDSLTGHYKDLLSNRDKPFIELCLYFEKEDIEKMGKEYLGELDLVEATIRASSSPEKMAAFITLFGGGTVNYS
jgi:hypothetical protein